MKLRIVGEAAPSGAEERWPDAIAPTTPVRVLYDVRGESHDRRLLLDLRHAGLSEAVLLASEGAPRVADLEQSLGSGIEVRDHGGALVASVQRSAGPPLAIGAAAARAFRSRLTVRIDPGLRSAAIGPLARGIDADLTLRDGWPEVLLPLLEPSRWPR